MMSTTLAITSLALVLGLVDEKQPADATAPSANVKEQEVDHRHSQTQHGGLWPSRKMTRLLLERWADELSRQFNLSEEQRRQVSTSYVEGWSKYLDENRDDLEPLLNEFLEMRLELSPPSKERVQKWSRQATDALAGVKKQFDVSTQEFRKTLTPEQQTKFDATPIKIKAGLLMAEQKLAQWREGQFDEREFWEPTASFEQRQGNKTEVTESAAPKPIEASTSKSTPAEPPDAIFAELQRWEEYVEQFAEKYRLDKGQRSAAKSCFDEVARRAKAHRLVHKQEISQLEHQISTSYATEEELQVIEKELKRLYGPVDDLFAELQSRLQQIPTQAQRADSAKRTVQK